MIPQTDDMNHEEENSEDLYKVIAILLESNKHLKNKIWHLEHNDSSKSCIEAEDVSCDYGHDKSGYYLSQKLDKFLKENTSCNEAELEGLSSKNCEGAGKVSDDFGCVQSGSYKSKERKKFLNENKFKERKRFLEVKKSC